MKNYDVLFKNIDTLGEGPILDYVNNQIYWVDIGSNSFHIYSFEFNKLSTYKLDRSITSISLSFSGNLYCTSGHGFFQLYQLVQSKFEMRLISKIEENLQNNRFNDGKAGPDGNYWAGTMDIKEKSPTGSMYILSPKVPPRKIISNLIVSNGLTWDSENNIFYLVDSARRIVTSNRYDDNFNIVERQIAVKLEESEGFPDGMTIDAEGNLWIAHWNGGRISEWNPISHKKLQEVILPAKNITSCCFYGKGLNRLFITSAKLNQSPIVKQYNDPNDLGGSIFLIDSGTEGTLPFKLNEP